MKRFLVILSLLAVLLPAVPARADHAGPGHLTYTWPTHSAVVEDRTGSPAVRTALAYAVGRWNASGADLTLSYRDGPATDACGFEGNVISVCHDVIANNEGRSAQTNLSLSGSSTLAGAWIEMDEWVYQGIGAPNLTGIVAHEIGHAVCCYDHSDEVSIMNPLFVGAHCGFECSGPDQHDNEVLIQLYGPAAAPPPTTTVPTTTTTTTQPPVTTTTTTPAPTTPTTTPTTTTTPTATGYCAQLRAARQQVADAMRGPWFAAARAQTLAVIDADLAECPAP